LCKNYISLKNFQKGGCDYGSKKEKEGSWKKEKEKIIFFI